MNSGASIPRPLVRTNQWVIVLSVVLTWVTGAYWILLIPFISGLMGIVFGFNPVMRFAKLFLRKPFSDYVPEDRDQQQFNQIIAVVCLALGLMGYIANWMVVAYIFTAMVALAAFIAILGFCIGCFIRFQWTQYRHRRAQRQS
jgi:Kef-type K+ transport system membrane component KefB